MLLCLFLINKLFWDFLAEYCSVLENCLDFSETFLNLFTKSTQRFEIADGISFH